MFFEAMEISRSVFFLYFEFFELCPLVFGEDFFFVIKIEVLGNDDPRACFIDRLYFFVAVVSALLFGSSGETSISGFEGVDFGEEDVDVDVEEDEVLSGLDCDMPFRFLCCFFFFFFDAGVFSGFSSSFSFFLFLDGDL